MRERNQVDTSTNAYMAKPKEPPTPNGVKEPGLPINVPLSIVRWIAYSICFAGLLIPMTKEPWQIANGGLILGWFASQLNALINKK